jgi:ketosteroid isomerase-like protein
MATAAENKEIVRAAYEGMATGNPKAFFDALDPEIVIIEPDPLPYGGTYRGQGEVMEFMQAAGQVVDGSTLRVESLTADEDRVVATVRLAVQAGGEVEMSEHWTMRDGKATELRVFCFDPTTVAAPA